MRDSKYAVMITIFKVMVRHRKNWCKASQQRILTLLDTYHGVKIQRRMLCYHLADLRETGFIKTIQRKGRNKDGTLHLLPSAHCITLKGYLYLASKAVRGAWAKAQELRRRYFPLESDDQPTKSPTTETPEYTPKPGRNPFLDPHFRKHHGLKTRFEDLEKNGSAK